MKREERPGGEGRLVSQSAMQLVNSHGKVSVYFANRGQEHLEMPSQTR